MHVSPAHVGLQELERFMDNLGAELAVVHASPYLPGVVSAFATTEATLGAACAALHQARDCQRLYTLLTRLLATPGMAARAALEAEAFAAAARICAHACNTPAVTCCNKSQMHTTHAVLA
jgi:hypothetical protein